MDKDVRSLVSLFSAVRIKTGLELAQRLKEIDDNKLYSKLDERAYPKFNTYIESLGMNYKTIRELIGIYESYILEAGYTIEELSEIPYNKLSVIKPYLFDKKDNKYVLTKPKSEVNKWLKEASSDLSINDLRQSRREAEVGPHEHKMKLIKFKVCEICGDKEYGV